MWGIKGENANLKHMATALYSKTLTEKGYSVHFRLGISAVSSELETMGLFKAVFHRYIVGEV